MFSTFGWGLIMYGELLLYFSKDLFPDIGTLFVNRQKHKEGLKILNLYILLTLLKSEDSGILG